MIKKIKLVICSLLIFFYYQTNLSLSEKVSIIYVVENNPITNVAINDEIKYLLLINERLNQISREDMIQYASKSILKEKIKEIEIKKYYEFGKNNKEINKNLDILMRKLNISDDEIFYNLISKIGLTKEFISKKIEIEFLWNQLIVNIYKDKIFIDEALLYGIMQLQKKIRKKGGLER